MTVATICTFAYETITHVASNKSNSSLKQKKKKKKKKKKTQKTWFKNNLFLILKTINPSYYRFDTPIEVER